MRPSIALVPLSWVLASLCIVSLLAAGKPEPPPWLNEGVLVGVDVQPHYTFGQSVAIGGGDTVAVGAPDMVVEDVITGGAYIFAKENGAWVEQFKFEPDDGNENDEIGWSVAADGDLALVGTRRGLVGSQTGQGAVYAFARSGGVWQQTQKLTASDGDEQDWFGTAIALDGNTVLVGAPRKDIDKQEQGAVYVFARAGNSWVEEAKLFDPNGDFSDAFGLQVALDGDRALIGAEAANINGNTNQGAAYVFDRVGTTWTLTQRLLASEPVTHLDQFGSSVAVDGDRILVGAERAPIGGLNRHGAAFFFERQPNGTWKETQRVLASNAQAEGNFGRAAALEGDLALIGGNSMGAAEQGTVYVFRRVAGVWVEEQQILAPEDPSAFDGFGQYIALDGERAVIAHRGYFATGGVWVLRDGHVFADGFESGDTAGWSETVGASGASVPGRQRP